LSDYCIPVTAVSSRHLRSVNQHQLTVPRCRRIKLTFGRRSFSVLRTLLSGTHYRLSFVICLSVLVFLGALLRRYYSRDIIASSAIEMYA